MSIQEQNIKRAVISASVEVNRAQQIRQSRRELDRSISWVVNKILDMGWNRYFKVYPLSAKNK